MLKEFENRLSVISESYVDVYSAASGGIEQFWYPYKLQSPGAAEGRSRETCFQYILDSGIGKDITNAEIIEKAEEMRASYVVPKDYMHDRDRTTESVEEFFSLYKESDCYAKPIIPLQPPHDEHYEDLKGYSYYAVGGVKDWDNKKKIEAVKATRETVGPSKMLHGFGVGVTEDLVDAVQRTPNLLDSIDSSTPSVAIKNNSIYDESLSQFEFDVPNGQKSSAVRSHGALLMLMVANFVLSPNYDYEPISENGGMSW